VTEKEIVYADHSRNQRVAVPFTWLFISLLIFTACLGGGGNNNDAVVDDSIPLDVNQGRVVCNNKCNDRGQCGERTDGTGQVVLINSAGPTAEGHDRYIPAQTDVQILGFEMRTLQFNGGEISDLPFYFVSTMDQTRQGWVAGWCVAPPEGQ
jgi:hypothetical protein